MAFEFAGMSDASQMIVGCLAGAAALGAAEAIATGTPPPIRQVVGFAAVGVGLSVGALFAPGLASGLAALVLVSAVFVYGQPLFDNLASFTSSTSSTSSTTKPAKKQKVVTA